MQSNNERRLAQSRPNHRRLRAGAALSLLLLAFARVADAQRANENAVAEASDAFGTAIGREVIGLYTPESARGFSPAQAGNLRISGLYYDQVNMANLIPFIARGSTVHVGISAQGFPFPAPTGVVDFQLRTPGAASSANVLLGYASYDQAYAELDAEQPLGDKLRVGVGGGYSLNNVYKYATRTEEWTAGTIARWQPANGIVITPFWGMARHREDGAKPVPFLGSAGVPRFRSVDMPAQPWAAWGYDSSNFGTTVRAHLGANWMLDAGVFRSEARNPVNYEIFLTDLDSAGQGNYSFSASPRHETHSTSGEVRLTKRLDTEKLRNNIIFAVKGRDRSAESGGADVLDYGRATTTSAPIFPMPVFHPGPATVVAAKQVTPGIAYEGIWRERAQVSLGLQKSFYDRTIAAPGSPEVSTSASPLIYNAGAAFFLTKKLIAYASTTRGFEEIGTAPINAANRDEAVPAQMTKQVDAGIRYQFHPNLALVAGVFEIDKPYFDLDASNIFRNVGSTRNRGVELSLSGALTERLTVVAGLILIDPTVEYEAGPSGHRNAVAVGPQPGLFSANLQYRPRVIEGLVLDAKVETISSRYARYKEISLPAVTTLDAGTRYNTKLFGKAATFRFQLYNLTGEYALTPKPSGLLEALDGRRFELSLAVTF